jgi:hypothetical protein
LEEINIPKKAAPAFWGITLKVKLYAEQPQWSSLTDHFSKKPGRRNKSHTKEAEGFNTYSDLS